MLYVAYRWFDRLVGIFSLIIMARLLLPEHFGIVAMASIVVGLLDQLLNFGVPMLVLQKDKLTEEFVDSAWTLRLAQAIFVGLSIALLAPLAAEYYREERVATAMYVLALAAALYGLENFAQVLFQRDRKFFKEFQLAAIKRVSVFVVVIGMAVVLKSFWALVLGTLFSRLLAVALSYAFYPVVHSLNFRHFRELFGGGKWLLAMNALNHLWVRVDELVVGRLFSVTAMGNYTLASEIARMPTHELLSPISRALLPGLTSLRGDLPGIRRLVLMGTNVQASLGLPAALGLSLCGGQISALILGPGWDLAAQLLTLLPLAFVAHALVYSSEYYLLAFGQQRLLSFILVAYLIAFFVFLGLLRLYFGGLDLTAVVLSRVAVEVIGVPTMWFAASIVSGNISVRSQTVQVLRPLVAVSVMVAVLVLAGVLENTAGILTLAGYVILGAVTYTVTLTLIWILAGSPSDGIEQYVVARLRKGS